MIRTLLKRIKFFFYTLLDKPIFCSRFTDQFYQFQQDRLRGSAAEIKTRQEIYLKYIKNLDNKISTEYPFLDCGFGRGEFLELLRENNIQNIIGADSNKNFVENMRKKKYDVIHSDIIKYLYLTTMKFKGISAFHLIEHLAFPKLFDFLVLCNKKLVKGGILILETPNVENISVSSTTFYYDHTHIQRLPKVFIQTVLKFIGFAEIEFLYLHPVKPDVTNDVERKIYGPQDLGVIAYKR